MTAKRLRDDVKNRSEGVNAVVKVPAGAVLDLGTSNGSVKLTGGTGKGRYQNVEWVGAREGREGGVGVDRPQTAQSSRRGPRGGRMSRPRMGRSTFKWKRGW